jgi:choline dehydrogenase-like flavoprotein
VPILTQPSGIGPEGELQSHKIPVLRHLPGVGKDLNDHVSFGIIFEVAAADTLAKILSPLIGLWHFFLFLLFRAGLLAAMSVNRCIWVRSSAIDDATMTVRLYGDENGEKHDNMDSARPENIPDIEYLMVPAATTDGGGRKGYSTLLCTLTQPLSRGTIELVSSDPLASPRFHHPMFRDARDFLVARKSVRFAMHYVERFRTKGYPFKSVWHSAPGVKLGTLDGTWKDATDKEIDAFIKNEVVSTYHATSTCRMAPESDGGVVDQELRVHGFRNLRVADASVFPKITSAHTMAPTLMIAERCADMVKETWRSKAE